MLDDRQNQVKQGLSDLEQGGWGTEREPLLGTDTVAMLVPVPITLPFQFGHCLVGPSWHWHFGPFSLY